VTRPRPTAQIADCSTGVSHGTGRAAQNPCLVIKLSTGTTVGGFLTREGAERAAQVRGARVVEETPTGWSQAHRRGEVQEGRGKI
jgi:hypothetical protein